MTKAKEAVERFANGSICSQAILCAFSSHVDVDEKTLHKLGTGFGAGFGRKQYTCGAVTGAVAILSLKYGNENPGDFQVKENTYDVIYDFIERVETRLGSSNCKELLGYPIKEKSDIQAAVKAGIFQEICPKCIETVAEELERLL